VKNMKKWIFVVILLAALFFLSSIIASIVSTFGGIELESADANTAVIPIKGLILVDESKMFGQDIVSSTEVVASIEKADKSPNIKAMILDINSPGGSAVASEEIAHAVKKTNKTTVALIREVGASGGYWIATAADHIVASRISVTGSIGVLGSYPQIAGLLNEHNITYQRLVSGKYKDMGSPLKELTNEERAIIQSQLDLIHDYFIESVAENRKLEKKTIKKLATGQIYLGLKAIELGLIDELGGKDETIQYIENKLNITVEMAEFKEKKTILDLFSEVFNEKSFYVGQGIGSAFLDRTRTVNRMDIWT